MTTRRAAPRRAARDTPARRTIAGAERRAPPLPGSRPPVERR
ncbi:hypothetical protein [Streptomyces collinus]|nr:hypothetical protein [Streptomyces collinus]